MYHTPSRSINRVPSTSYDSRLTPATTAVDNAAQQRAKTGRKTLFSAGPTDFGVEFQVVYIDVGRGPLHAVRDPTVRGTAAQRIRHS